LAFLGEFGMNHVESRKETEGGLAELVNSLTCLGERRKGAMVVFRAEL